MNYDKNRKLIYKLMKEYGIHNGSEKYKRLFTFLLNENNAVYLQLYLIICSGYMSVKEVIPRLEDLVAELEFTRDGYTYRDLFNMDSDWSDYFKENAYPYPSGQRKSKSDKRRGVDREYVDFIMSVKKGPPPVDLEQAICNACKLRYPIQDE